MGVQEYHVDGRGNTQRKFRESGRIEEAYATTSIDFLIGSGDRMRLWGNWVRYPQSLWLRKSVFRIHRWTGIGAGLYILLMSSSGSLIVYRDELTLAFSRAPVIVANRGPRMTLNELRQAAQRQYPEYKLTNVYQRTNPKQAVEITFERAGKRVERLFDPYTGADLGNHLRTGFRALVWLLDLHDNLLSGQTGRLVNGIGGLCLTVLALTGSVIWWPGIQNWRRSLTIDRKAGSKRFLWTLHSVLGFWFFLFVLLWGVSGIYLCFPRAFNVAVNFFNPLAPGSHVIRGGDVGLYWLSRLHFGRFAGGFVKAVWVVVGLVPATLFLTGVLMWWNRVVRNRLRQWRRIQVS
jgi:uncharacterized iron-regulated membrane protein